MRWGLGRRSARGAGAPAVDHGGLPPVSPTTEPWDESGDRRPARTPVRVAVAQNEAEASLMRQRLAQFDIRAIETRTGGFDVPDMMAAGPRDIRVLPADELIAREVLGTSLPD